MRETALSKDLGLVCKSCFFSLLLILVYFCLLYAILWLSLEEACPVQDLRWVSVHTTFSKQSWDMQWDWITLCREATFLPLYSLMRAHPAWAPGHVQHAQIAPHEKSIPSHPSLKSQQIFCVPTGAGKWVAAALPKTHSHYNLGAESWGNFDSAVLGRAAGRHVPAWVSVGLCIPPSSSSFLGHPSVRHGRYQFLCCARWHRLWISVPIWSMIPFFFSQFWCLFFLPRSHRFLVCSPFTKRVCKGIPQSMQNGHLHILLTESVLSFQL